MSDLRYQQQTYELRGLIFEARKRLRTGWPEDVYREGLVQIMREHDVPVATKLRKTVFHRGIEVHLFECDVMAWDLIILELKTLPYSTFTSAHFAQLINYLKCWNKHLGLLVNFGSTRADIQRIVWDEPQLDISEHYDAINPLLSNSDRVCLDQIRQHIMTIGQQYGLGYSEVVYRRIAAIEMQYNGLCCEADVEVPAKLGARLLQYYKSDHLLIENRCLLSVRSLLDHPPAYDFARMKTYLNSLGLAFGLIVNFGKKELQLYGVNPD